MNDKEKYENVGEATGNLILNLTHCLMNYLNSCRSSLYNLFAKNKSISTEDICSSSTESKS